MNQDIQVINNDLNDLNISGNRRGRGRGRGGPGRGCKNNNQDTTDLQTSISLTSSTTKKVPTGRGHPRKNEDDNAIARRYSKPNLYSPFNIIDGKEIELFKSALIELHKAGYQRSKFNLETLVKYRRNDDLSAGIKEIKVIEDDRGRKRKIREEKIEAKRLSERDFFALLNEDTIVIILRYLERNQIIRLQRLSSSFYRFIQSALKYYPPEPKWIESRGVITNENGSCDIEVKWRLENTIDIKWKVTHWILEVNNFSHIKPRRIVVPRDRDSWIIPTPVNVNVTKNYSIVLFAMNEMSGTRSISKKETIDPPKKETPDVKHIITPIITPPIPSYYDRYTPSDTFKGCFDGRALVKMADLTKKYANTIVVGDLVMGGDGKPYKVKQVMSNFEKCDKLMVNLSNFWITRGHPILQKGDWYRPDEITKSELMTVEHGLINFLLEGDEHTVMVGGKEGKNDGEIICCTLGKYCGARLASLYPHHNEMFHLAYLKK